MVKNSAIESLYNSRLHSLEEGAVRSKEYKEQVEIVSDLYDEVSALLDENGRQLLDKFLDEKSQLTTCSEKEKFKDGFVMGTRLMVESLVDKRIEK